MKRIFKNKKAQNTAEYAILIALVIAAAMAIQTYVKRGIQAKVRDAVIHYTTKTSGTTGQYEPYYLDSDFTTTADSSQTVEEKSKGGWDRTSVKDITGRKGIQQNTPSKGGG